MIFLKTLISKGLYLLKMCSVLAGTVHNFSKSDGDVILWKSTISNRCISSGFDVQLDQKILDGLFWGVLGFVNQFWVYLIKFDYYVWSSLNQFY